MVVLGATTAVAILAIAAGAAWWHSERQSRAPHAGAPQPARLAANDAGQPKQAMAILQDVLARHPHDRDTLAALIAYSRGQGDARQALTYGRRLGELEPASADVRRLVERLEAEARR